MPKVSYTRPLAVIMNQKNVQMKKALKILLLFLSVSIYSQKIGVVYDINPQMGYVYMKGAFKAVPVLQENVDFNFIMFLEEYLQKRNINYELKNDFDFSKLENLNLKFSNKKEIEYVNKYSEDNGFDKILIVRRNTNYDNAALVLGIDTFDYDFGIGTQSLSKRNAFLFTNFLIFPYKKGDKAFKNIFGYFFKSRKFESVYDENFKLKNEEVFPFFLSTFKQEIEKKIEEFIK